MNEKVRDEIWIKALEVLRLGEDIEAADLAEIVSANPSTVRDALKSMESAEWIEQKSQDSEIWKAGPKARELLQISDTGKDEEDSGPQTDGKEGAVPTSAGKDSMDLEEEDEEEDEEEESEEPFQGTKLTNLNLDEDISPPEIGDQPVPGTSYQLPYVIERTGKSRTSWDRPHNIRFKLFEETEEMFDELSEWIDEEVYPEVGVLRSDIRQAAFLVGVANPMEVVAVLNAWGYNELTN